VLLKEFRTKVNLKGVKLNTKIDDKEAQKQQNVYRTRGLVMAEFGVLLLNG